jgi:hypothetical protein
VTFPRFLLDSGESIQRMTVPWAAAVTVWWCLPLLGLLLGSQSRMLRWGGSMIYVGVAAWTLAGVYRSESSTAVFGIVFPPLYLALAVAVLLGLEAVTLRRGRPNRQA